MADRALRVTHMMSRADDQLAIPARVLSSTQLALLAQRGEELTALPYTATSERRLRACVWKEGG